MSGIGIAALGHDGLETFMTRMSGSERGSAENRSRWDWKARVDGQEYDLSLSSPYWGAREGARRRTQRLYKNDIFYFVLDLTKDAERLQYALNHAKRIRTMAVHREYAAFYLVGVLGEEPDKRKLQRAEVEELARQNNLTYAEVNTHTGAGLSDLLQSSVRKFVALPRKPSLEELMSPEGVKA